MSLGIFVQHIHLLEILESRQGRGSKILTGQQPVGLWHEAIADTTLADAILDRLVRSSTTSPVRGMLSSDTHFYELSRHPCYAHSRTAPIFQIDLAKHPLPMLPEGLPCKGVGCLAGPVRQDSGP
ncbi:MAG: ATP-binding protein [Rhodobacteraceae bacterium]|nr:ATP-binding protein [Paracoccaceae bacterium]